MPKFFRDIWYFRYTVGYSWPKAVESAFWASRVGMAVHVLIGRPIAYGLTIEDGAMKFSLYDKAIVQNCKFISARNGIKVSGLALGA